MDTQFVQLKGFMNRKLIVWWLGRARGHGTYLGSLFGGSSRGRHLLLYPWPKHSPLSGKVVVFYWERSPGGGAHGVTREVG